MGRVGMEIAPASTMTMAHTVANTGRLMKKSTNTERLRHNNVVAPGILDSSELVGRLFGTGLCGLCVGRRLFGYRRSVFQELRARNDQVIAGLNAFDHFHIVPDVVAD